MIRKQLKKEYPDWNRLTKKEKKRIAKDVLNEAVSSYDFRSPVDAPMDELLGIEEQIPVSGIISLKEMPDFIENNRSDRLFDMKKRQHNLYGQDDELRIIDSLLDDQVINALLSYDGYSPAMRDFFPVHFFRAELRKTVKYPEISYRKFCDGEYLGRDRQANRLFIGLPLNSDRMISHVQLSQFRTNLTFLQMINITSYILYLFLKSGILGDRVVHCIDSTELTADNQELLATVEIKGRKIRIYDDVDCDCGKRRKKRNKSVYVIGYRMHTLTAVNAETGHSYPLISLLAPANHHDSNFHEAAVRLGKAVGLEIKLITADEAYTGADGSFFEKTGVHLITPPKSKVKTPTNTDSASGTVFCDDYCEIPMDYTGIEDGCHDFRCGSPAGECFRESICPKFRSIPADEGRFQRILYNKDEVAQAVGIRKNAERPFNLLKNREGLETLRVRSQHGVAARCTFATMATLLLEIAGTRKKKRPVSNKVRQIPLPCAA